jgi:transcription initiation factor TFIIIB Brf1 subunit/transcription initiation factor TFIIB
MNTGVGLSFRPKACRRCGGDAYLSRGEDVEWVCLQCGRVVPDLQALASVDTGHEVRSEPVADAVPGRAA